LDIFVFLGGFLPRRHDGRRRSGHGIDVLLFWQKVDSVWSLERFTLLVAHDRVSVHCV